MKIIAVIAIILIAILFIPFYITINLNRKNDNDNIEISLIVFRIIKLDYEIPFIDIISQKGQVSLELIKKVEEQASKKDIAKDKAHIKLDDIIQTYNKIKKYENLYKAVSNYILDKIEIKKIKWTTRIGFDDAAVTGIVIGVFWIIQSLVFSILLHNKYTDDSYINVIPKFGEKIFEVNFYCIIKLKLVYIIIAGYKGVKAHIKGGGLNV